MLRILGSTWGGFSRLRASMYERGWRTPRRLNKPVISIGALSVGGAGKTPATALVASLLQQAGVQPAILSRGYRRSGKEPLLVSSSDGRGPLVDYRAAGDEPFWLASALPGVAVAVAARREEAARLTSATTDVYLLDDGFQHIRVARDVDLLVVNPEAPFWTDRPLPAGHLREPPTAAERADAFLVIGDDPDTRTGLEHRAPGRDQFELTPQPPRCRQLAEPVPAATPTGSGGGPDLGACLGRRVFAFAGIARPERFFRDLAAAGVDLCGQRAFADHHAYVADDLQAVTEAASAAGAEMLVTTEKDAVRIPQRATDRPSPSADIPVGVWGYRLSAREPERLVDWLLSHAGLTSKTGAPAASVSR